MSPAILLHVIGAAVFIRLEDISTHLPPYHEHVHQVDPEPQLLEAYTHIENQYHRARNNAAFAYRARVASSALQNLLSYADSPHLGMNVSVKTGRSSFTTIHTAPIYASGGPDNLWAKERKLIELLQRNHAEGHRTLVYYTNTGVRDIAPRLMQITQHAGFEPAVLKATVKPENREEWIANKVKDGANVLFTNPSLVETGLDLLDFPKIIWYQVCYRTITVKQASHRSWRIPQVHPVTVDHIVYKATTQAPALIYIATKVHTSNMFEGDLVGDGLDDLAGDDALGSLAKLLFDNGTAPEDGLETLFATLEQTTQDRETYLDASYQLDNSSPAEASPPHSAYEQYQALKRQHPTTILFFRMGDFYEAFEDDAKLVAQELQITLTSRPFAPGQRTPMAGVPYHSLDSYLSKLTARGHTVAVTENVQHPEAVITTTKPQPHTLSQLLDEESTLRDNPNAITALRGRRQRADEIAAGQLAMF